MAKTNNWEKKQRILPVKQIVLNNDWSFNDLRRMSDSKNEMYTRGINAGISDGMARRFAGDLYTCKAIFREQEVAANSLLGAGGFHALGIE